MHARRETRDADPTRARAVVVASLLIAASPGCGDDGGGSTSDAGTGSASATTETSGETSGESSGETAAPPVELCDGSSALRFAMYLPTSVERVEPVSYTLWENGARFLFVFGDCGYWVSGPNNPTRVDRYRAGQLTPADVEGLTASFFFGQWSARSLTGYWLPSPDDFDLPTTVFFDGQELVVCQGGCGALGVREEVHAMRDAEQGWIDALWSAGAPSDGALRVLAVRIAEGDPTFDAVPTALWPLGSSLAALAFEDPEAVPMEPGQSARVDAEQAPPLIAIWEEYLSGAHGELWRSHGSIPFTEQEGGPRYRVFLRDALPFEDAQGLVDAPEIR